MAAPAVSREQYRVLVWFCREISRALFLEALALSFIPTIANVAATPPAWLLVSGFLFSLTLFIAAVMLAKKIEA